MSHQGEGEIRPRPNAERVTPVHVQLSDDDQDRTWEARYNNDDDEDNETWADHDDDGTDDETTPLIDSRQLRASEDYPTRLPKWRIWKNLLSLSLAYTFVYTSYMSLQNLESSLHLQKGLGVTTLSCVFGGMFLSSLYAPMLIRVVGTKCVMIALFIAVGLFAAAHYSPTYYTLLPAAILLGLLSSPGSASESVYIANMARVYASATKEAEPEATIAWFNGIYLAFFQVTQVTGNLIAGSVLKAAQNVTANESDHSSNVSCGRNFCPGDNVTGSANFDLPPDDVINRLASIFIACCVVGLLLMLLLTDRCRDIEKAMAGKRQWLEDVLGTLVAHFHRWLACLIPLFLWTGVEQAFLFSEYTGAFVTCELGITHVGFAMIGFGAADMLGSLLVGRIEKRCGRPLLLVLAAVVNASLFLTMLWWKPSHDTVALLYVIPALWGLADAVWQITVTALIATEFPGMQESAFSMFRLWQAAGFTVTFAISQFLCMYIKIYIDLALLALALALYAVSENRIRYNKSRPWIDLHVAL